MTPMRLFLTVCDLVLTFSIAAYPVCLCDLGTYKSNMRKVVKAIYWRSVELEEANIFVGPLFYPFIVCASSECFDETVGMCRLV